MNDTIFAALISGAIGLIGVFIAFYLANRRNKNKFIISNGKIEYNKHNIKIFYPAEWIMIDRYTTKADFARLVNLGENINKAIPIDFNRREFKTVWLDLGNTRNNFTPNINMIVSNSYGFTQNHLKIPRNQKEIFDVMHDLPSHINYRPISHIESKVLGNNYFILLKYNADMLGNQLSFYNAVTIICGKTYTFTYTVLRGQLDNSEATSAFENMLSTLEGKNGILERVKKLLPRYKREYFE